MNSSLKKDTYFKLSRVRILSMKFHLNRVITFSVLGFLFVFLDLFSIYFVRNDTVDDAYGLMNNGVPSSLPLHSASPLGDNMSPFIIGIIMAILLVAIFVTLISQIISADKHNNQTDLELRTGYDRKDIYGTKITEIVIAFLILYVIVLIGNGAAYGALKNTVYVQYWHDGSQSFIEVSAQNKAAPILLWDMWWYLVAFIVTALVTVGLSFGLSTGGTASLGAIASAVIVVIIILASLGLFSAPAENGMPSPWFTPLPQVG